MWLQAQMLWIWEGVYDVLLYLLELIALTQILYLHITFKSYLGDHNLQTYMQHKRTAHKQSDPYKHIHNHTYIYIILRLIYLPFGFDVLKLVLVSIYPSPAEQHRLLGEHLALNISLLV